MKKYSIRLGFSTVIGACILLSPTTYGWANTGSEIVQMCADYPNGTTPQLCETYIESIVEYATSVDKDVNQRGKLCIEKDTPVSELISQINNWFSSHPNRLSENMFDATYDALSQVHKCK